MILALDASGSEGQIALVQAGAVGLELRFPTGPQHGGRLFASLQEAWMAAGDAVTEVRLGLGPGSYAGVRMAIAAALGLALARNVPILGLPSVCACSREPRYVVIGDARRGGFYFSAVAQGQAVEGPEIVEHDALLARLAAHPGLPVFAADAATLALAPGARPAQAVAAILAELAPPSVPLPLEPIYLRAPHITQPKARQTTSAGNLR